MQPCSCTILMIINTNKVVPQSSQSPHGNSLVHLDVEDCSEELFRRQSYAIKNQFQYPNPHTRTILGTKKDSGATLVLYATSIHLKGADNWTFPCIEANSLRSNTLKSEAPIKFDPRERIKLLRPRRVPRGGAGGGMINIPPHCHPALSSQLI